MQFAICKTHRGILKQCGKTKAQHCIETLCRKCYRLKENLHKFIKIIQLHDGENLWQNAMWCINAATLSTGLFRYGIWMQCFTIFPFLDLFSECLSCVSLRSKKIANALNCGILFNLPEADCLINVFQFRCFVPSSPGYMLRELKSHPKHCKFTSTFGILLRMQCFSKTGCMLQKFGVITEKNICIVRIKRGILIAK